MRRTNSLLALSVLALAVLACRCQPEPPQPPDKASAVKLELDGQRIQASIAAGQRTTYAVEVPAGSGVYLYMIPELGLNLNAEVRDEAGYRVESGGHSYANNGRYALVTFASRLGGNYYVTLSPGGGAGRYYLEAKGGCGGGRVDRLPVLRRGSEARAELGDYPDFADYIIETDDERVDFIVDPDYGFDTRVSIYGLDCQQLLTLENRYSRRGDGPRVATFDPKFRRRYIVRVAISTGGGGKFKLNVR